MNFKSSALIFSSLLLASSPSYALFGFGDDSDTKIDADTVSSLASSLSSQVSQQQNSPIVDALTSSLDVSTEQAAGGAGALLALASSSLSDSNAQELSSLIPGMDSLGGSASGLLSMASNMSAINDVFTTLGLDPSMVSQFTPVILEYLTGQGASTDLLSSLTSIWN